MSCQAPPLSDMPKYFGISGPISEDLPEEADLVQTKKLMDLLKSYGVFEDDSELQHRETVVKRLESLFKEWLKEICLEMNVPESVTANVGGKVLPFGSYYLGAHSKGADIDVLCVGPGFIERKEFFTSFYEKLKAQQEVKDIQAIEEAFVPVIKLSFDGIEIDMVFARIARKSVSERINLLDDQWLMNIDKQCVRSLNGYRVSEEILSLVPNVHNFRLALRVIKHWAKCRNIYSNKLGFLGGVSWTILMARICQVYPNATVSTLVIKFFKVYSMWEWPIPIRLRVVEDRQYNLPFWDPRFNVADRSHHMPIITPAYPQQNTAFNVSPSTFSVITAEIERGHIIAQQIQQGKADWSQLFDAPDLEKFQHFVLLRVSSATEKQHTQWSGLVESKIRHLVGILESNENVNLAHVHIQPFHEHRTDINKDGVSTTWLIGLFIASDTDRSKKQKIDLTSDLLLFSDTMHIQAKSFKIYEEGMTISAVYCPREKLSWKMPNGESKRFLAPKPKPEVSHNAPAKPKPEVSHNTPAKPKPEVSHNTPAKPKPEVSHNTPAKPKPEVSHNAPAKPKPEVSHNTPAKPKPEVSHTIPAKPKPEVSHNAPAKPKPEVSHNTPAAVQPRHTQPASTCQADRKRKDLLQPEMPAKRMKADKEPVSMTKAFTFSKPALLARISEATKRPCSPNPEPSSKKLKCDDNKELLCPPSKSPNLKRRSAPELEEPAKKFKPDLSEPPDELSEEPPAPTKPVTMVKNTIKLHLLRRN